MSPLVPGVVIAVLIILVVFSITTCSSNQKQETTENHETNTGSHPIRSVMISEEDDCDFSTFTYEIADASLPFVVSRARFGANDIEFIPTTSALDDAPEAKQEPQTFALANGKPLELHSGEMLALKASLSAIEDKAPVGCLIYNTKTGRGIAYNIDETIYGASSIKAPYALYILEEHVETGEISIPGVTEEGTSANTTKNNIEQAIGYSDNTSFWALRRAYDSQGYDSWALSVGANDALDRSDSSFPWYCSRTQAKFWTEMYTYFQDSTPAANWLSSLCANTNRSFIRDALSSSGAYVRNKAGWSSGQEGNYNYNAVTDAGIIEINDNTYIMSIMAYIPYTEENEHLVEDAISTLYTVCALAETRNQLN